MKSKAEEDTLQMCPRTIMAHLMAKDEKNLGPGVPWRSRCPRRRTRLEAPKPVT